MRMIYAVNEMVTMETTQETRKKSEPQMGYTVYIIILTFAHLGGWLAVS